MTWSGLSYNAVGAGTNLPQFHLAPEYFFSLTLKFYVQYELHLLLLRTPFSYTLTACVLGIPKHSILENSQFLSTRARIFTTFILLRETISYGRALDQPKKMFHLKSKKIWTFGNYLDTSNHDPLLHHQRHV